MDDKLERFAKCTFVPWDKLNNAKVLVTGASGLIGSAIVKLLLERNRLCGSDMTICAAVRNIEKANKKFDRYKDRTDLKITQIDFANSDCHFENESFDYIIHCAGVTGNPKYFVDTPVEVLSTAINGIVEVLSLARKTNVRGVIFLSSWEVYGVISSPTTIRESDYGYIDLEQVRTSYKESKRVCEQLCVAYASEYGTPVKIARISITSGPGVDDSDRRFLPQFIRTATAGNDIVLRSSGETIRSHVYLYDCVTAILTILLKGTSGKAYNIGAPGAAYSIAEIAKMIAEICDVNVVYDMADDPQRLGYNNTVKAILNVDRLLGLGWHPLTTFYDMIRIMKEDQK